MVGVGRQTYLSSFCIFGKPAVAILTRRWSGPYLGRG